MRLGESTWSSWEPADGQFEFLWMERVIDAFHKAGISVILGTPTYAIPAWLHRQHPEIMATSSNGQATPYGSRQEMDVSHPAYRYYAERMIRTLVSHFAPHPAVIGFQVDNETGFRLLYNHHVFQRFIAWLKQRFGSVERLNEIWGLTYWSHRLSDWSDLWTPEGDTTPGYNLEWRRFQASLVTDFLAWQAAIVRAYVRSDQFCLEGGHGRAASDRFQIAQVVDLPAENPYHVTQDAMVYISPSQNEKSLSMWPPESGGGWGLSLKGDLGRSGQQRNFLVTEMNGLSILGANHYYPAYDGQWRLAAYTYISRGANSLAYWHWHTCHFGHEMEWQGILNHDLEPNRCYREISQIGQELQKYGDMLTDLKIDAEVAFLYSQDSKYSLEFHPCLSEPDPDKQSYQRIFDAFYRAFYDARAQTAIVHPAQEFDLFPVLVVPALAIADDALLKRLLDYAEQGGHLLLTFRTGYADEHGRARWNRAPGLLRVAVGASYQEYSHLSEPLHLHSTRDGQFDIPAEAQARNWADGLELEGAMPLAFYDHPHFKRFPAITTQAYGRGRVTYCGTPPNRLLGQALASWILTQAAIHPLMTDLPEPVRVSSARTQDGRQLWFMSNWSSSPQIVAHFPYQGDDLLCGNPVHQGERLEFSAWEMKIIVLCQAVQSSYFLESRIEKKGAIAHC